MGPYGELAVDEHDADVSGLLRMEERDRLDPHSVGLIGAPVGDSRVCVAHKEARRSFVDPDPPKMLGSELVLSERFPTQDLPHLLWAWERKYLLAHVSEKAQPKKTQNGNGDVNGHEDPLFLDENIAKIFCYVKAKLIFNRQLKELNSQGIFYIEDRKCNFDVEIGRDMLVDYDKNGIEHFILWSGDSDFASSIEQLLLDGKKVYIFATARKVASELNDLAHKGLTIFDIQKIRNFICWIREIKVL